MRILTLYLVAVVAVVAIGKILVPVATAAPERGRAHSPPFSRDYVAQYLGVRQPSATLAALQAWARGPGRADLEAWADAIDGACMGAACIELAALAVEESGMVAWAADQSCNDAAWRAAHHTEHWGWAVCDQGIAFGPWQIHDDRLRGADAATQARAAASILASRPEAWSTWPRAHKRAQRWLVAHPE